MYTESKQKYLQFLKDEWNLNSESELSIKGHLSKMKKRLPPRLTLNFLEVTNHLRIRSKEDNVLEAIYLIMNNITQIVMCDHCKLKPTRFNSLTKGYSIFCSPVCASRSSKSLQKAKDKWMKKYGVDNPSKSKKIQCLIKTNNITKYGVESTNQLESIKNKKIETCLKNFGVDNPSKNEDIKIKKEETTLENFGVKYSFQSNECKEKTLKTYSDKYGNNITHCSQIKEVKEKRKQTTLKNFGVDHHFKSEVVKNNIKNTNIEIYGTKYPTQSKIVQEKSKQTCLKKYGAEYYFQSDIRKQLDHTKTINNYFSKKDIYFEFAEPLFNENDYTGLHKEYPFKCKKCGNIFYSIFGTDTKPKCIKCHPRVLSSLLELEVLNFIKQYKDVNILHGHRPIWLRPKKNSYPELDIYIPEKKLAIEFNGLYWHGENFGGVDVKKKHLIKTESCEKQGIQLIHIFENEWLNQQEIVKSIILAKLGIFKQKIFARKCEIRIVNHADTTEFLLYNHLQGSCISKYKLGLYYQDELVSLLTLGKPRFNKKYDYEIHRYCNKLNTTVVGGFAKLLKTFRKSNQGSIITYADRRYSKGNLYKQNGFIQLESSGCNYWYFQNADKLYHRTNFQKHKLKDKLEIFDPNLTEWENMLFNKWDRIWDCGNLVFEII